MPSRVFFPPRVNLNDVDAQNRTISRCDLRLCDCVKSSFSEKLANFLGKEGYGGSNVEEEQMPGFFYRFDGILNRSVESLVRFGNDSSNEMKATTRASRRIGN